MTQPIRTDYNERMAHSIIMAEAIIPDMDWHVRFRWWAWKRWQKGWMFWTPPNRVLEDAARGIVANLRARGPDLG